MFMDDVEIQMMDADPIQDLRVVLRSFSISSLLSLRAAFNANLVVCNTYRDGSGRKGCLMYFLAGVVSKQELLAYDFGSKEAWWAARRVVRFWDRGVLSRASVETMLDLIIEEKRTVSPNRDLLPQTSESIMAG